MFLEVVQLADGQWYSKHLFQTECLSAKLDSVHIRFLVSPTLELYRHSLGYLPFWREVKFHKIAFAD
jgi:hypothetical protein